MIDQIIKEITELVETRYVDYSVIEAVSPDSSIYDDLCLDSLDALQLFHDVETKFNITGLEEKIESIKTIRDIAMAVEASMGHKN